MSKNKLFNDAIAEAKSLKDAALSAAKIAMNESYSPQIQSMISSQLNEMEEMENEESLEEILASLDEMGGSSMREPSDSAASGAAELERMIKAAIAKAPGAAQKIKSFLKSLPAGAGAALRSEDVDLEEMGGSSMREPSDSAASGAAEIERMVKAAIAKAPGVAKQLASFLKTLPNAAGAALRSEDVDLEEMGGGSMREPSDSAASGAANLEKMVRAAIAKTPAAAKKIADFLKSLPAGAGAALRSENFNLGEEAEGDDEVGEVTVDELKDIIRDVMSELDGEVDNDIEDESGEENEEGDEFGLEEILAEMGGSSMREPSDSAASGAAELERMIKAAIAKAPGMATKIASFIKSLPNAAGAALRSESADLEEAIKTIKAQSKLIKEQNLLNAKLIYLNKIFKAKNLNESQKIQIIEAFDRTNSVKETQNTFKTISESFRNTTKTSLKENLGRASKPAGSAQRNLIVENKDFITRMQKLAGI